MAPLAAVTVLEDLLVLAQAGDRVALGVLLDRYRSYMELLARLQLSHQLQGKVDVQDLVQESFLKAHRSFSQFRGNSEGEWTAWLRQILATSAANQVRRFLGNKSRNPKLERELSAALDESSRCMAGAFAAPQSTPSQRAVRREQAVLLADALALLPADQRETVILRHLESLSFPDVAERMGRTVDSVKKLWARGLARLRVLMRSAE